MTHSPPTNTSGSEDRGGHTKGPWVREGSFHDVCRVEFEGGGHYVTVSASDRSGPIAFVIGDPNIYWREDVETEANARLIAAAPELLEALESFVKQWNACGPNSDFGRYFQPIRDRAVLIIAKSKGAA